MNKLIYDEKVQDLFNLPEDFFLAHCISADFALGKGIAVQFNKHFDMKNKLLGLYPDGVTEKWKLDNAKNNLDVYRCILVDRVFNLVTKERYYHKPTYDTLGSSLLAMRRLCTKNGVTKIGMPLIGCGLDRLAWNRVSDLIIDAFLNSCVEHIVVCKMEGEEVHEIFERSDT